MIWNSTEAPADTARERALREEFQRRYALCEEELTTLYLSLYPGQRQAFEDFVQMLQRSFRERPAFMLAADEARLRDPRWYTGNGMLGMLMYVSAFAGTLQGLRQKLDYIEECGVNYLHLMPLLESPAGRSDGGYAVADFRKVQPELGTMEDLAELGNECHNRGMCVCLDFVMNHTCEDHGWAKRDGAGEKE